MFCCPLCFVSPGQSINLFIVKKKRKEETMFPPHVTHKLLRWLICMNMEHVQVFIIIGLEDG